MGKSLVAASRQELHEMYWSEDLSTTQIAARLGVSKAAITGRFIALGILTRSRSAAALKSHKEGHRKRIPHSTPVKAELLCRACGANWKYNGFTLNTICPYCGKAKSARDSREYTRQYTKRLKRKQSLIEWYADADNRKNKQARYYALLKKRVFFRISGTIYPCCARCGCDDVRLLEINHKLGGGNKEYQKGKYSGKFYHDVATGKRLTDDLEILCKPCNGIHHLEIRFGKLPIKVVWSGHE